MSETMENAALNSGEIADRTPAAKAEETKADKFIRLGEYRMNKAIDAIGRIENLANRSAYEYTPERTTFLYSSSLYSRISFLSIGKMIQFFP